MPGGVLGTPITVPCSAFVPRGLQRAGTPLPSHPVTQSPGFALWATPGQAQSPLSAHFDSRDLRKIAQWSFAPHSEIRVSRWQNARKCYGRMSIHMRTKHAKNDTKTIKSDAVSSKNVQNQYGFVLPILTLLLHTPRGASAKAVLWIT